MGKDGKEDVFDQQHKLAEQLKSEILQDLESLKTFANQLPDNFLSEMKQAGHKFNAFILNWNIPHNGSDKDFIFQFIETTVETTKAAPDSTAVKLIENLKEDFKSIMAWDQKTE